MIEYTKNLMDFVWSNYSRKFPNNTHQDFEADFESYRQLPNFKANENIHEVLAGDSSEYKWDKRDAESQFIVSDSIKAEVHWIMRSVTQYFISQAFEGMKVDLDDPNVKENALGKGTPGRIAKMWCGNDPEDTTELGSGRWNREPVLSVFPNHGTQGIITKRVDLTSCCSHHFLPFSTLGTGQAIVAYKPTENVLGISKLQRFVNWAAKRFWLQEDLTDYLGETIKRIAKTDDVYIKIEGVVHGCEKYRGVNAHEGSLTTEYRSGLFNTEKSPY